MPTLTDFDYAVLAAARMGTLTARKKNNFNSAAKTFWFMHETEVTPSLYRLEQAGELKLTHSNAKILFPDTQEYDIYLEAVAFITKLRKGQL